MATKVRLFLVAFVVWVALTWPLGWQHGVAGIVIAGLVTAMTRDLYPAASPYTSRPAHYVRFLFHYLPVFLWECFKANLDVAYRVLHPRLPIRPGIVKVATNLRGDTGLTFLANSITLTPGTMCVDVDADHGALYVHWIDVQDTDELAATKKIVERFEHILKGIFEPGSGTESVTNGRTDKEGYSR